MSLPNLSGVGRLTQDPEIRFSSSGVAVCTVNLAFNSRRKNPQTNEWEDGEVFYVRGTLFKQLAENAVETLVKGMEVNVSGRLKTEQWQDKNTGDKRSAAALIIESIGPNLAYATAKVQKLGRDGGSSQQPRSAMPGDPWASVPAGQQSEMADEAPF
jgi:single-strand DNA-binding protein